MDWHVWRIQQAALAEQKTVRNHSGQRARVKVSKKPLKLFPDLGTTGICFRTGRPGTDICATGAARAGAWDPG